MSKRTAIAWMVALLIAAYAAMLVDASVARGDDQLVCHEDEVAWTVDYRTEGAVEDAVGVTRICIAMDTINDLAYEAGSQSGYEYGFLDGYGAAVDGAYENGWIDGWNAATVENQADTTNAVNHAWDQGYDAGWKDGLAEGPVQIIDAIRIITVPVVLPDFVLWPGRPY